MSKFAFMVTKIFVSESKWLLFLGEGIHFTFSKVTLPRGRVATDYRKWRPVRAGTHTHTIHTHAHKDKKSPLH